MNLEQFPILLVEDDSNEILFLQRAFSRAGSDAAIFFVPDSSRAIEYLTGEGEFSSRSDFPLPALIVTDLKMPGADGFWLLDWIRRHPVHCWIPIIVLSSSTFDADIKKAYALGARAYLVKPNDFLALRELIHAAYAFWRHSRLPMKTR